MFASLLPLAEESRSEARRRSSACIPAEQQGRVQAGWGARRKLALNEEVGVTGPGGRAEGVASAARRAGRLHKA